jgi:flagellar assembly protein FliH
MNDSKFNKDNRGIIDADEENQTDVWSLPKVQSPPNLAEESKTNAFGLKKTWRYEPPEEIEISEPEPLTAEEIEEIRQAAFEEGFNQGKEEGFAKGYEEGNAKGIEDGTEKGHQAGIETGLTEGQEKIDELANNWQTLMTQLHSPLASVEKNVEDQILHLTVQLAEAVINQEVQINPDILVAAISEGIKALPSQEVQTQILLNPEDIQIIEEKFGTEHIQEQGWRFIPAPHLEQGGCQIENSTSNIDLRMKSRIKEVLEPFLQDSLHQ